MTTRELTVKTELKYEVRVTLKFNTTSLALALSFDVMLNLSDLFTGVSLVKTKKEEVVTTYADLSQNITR